MMQRRTQASWLTIYSRDAIQRVVRGSTSGWVASTWVKCNPIQGEKCFASISGALGSNAMSRVAMLFMGSSCRSPATFFITLSRCSYSIDRMPASWGGYFARYAFRLPLSFNVGRHVPGIVRMMLPVGDCNHEIGRRLSLRSHSIRG